MFEVSVLDELDDDDLLEEVKARGLHLPADYEPTDMEMVEDAYHALTRGDVAEARCILDRLLHPKWPTVKSCEAEYARRHFQR